MRKGKKAGSITTFLDPDTTIEGTLEFQNTIRLEGNVKGKICSTNGTVIIGEQAVITAEIFVDVAIIMGRVKGTIDARERIEVYPPGRVSGNMHAPVISIESGVVFNGTCAMKAQNTFLKTVQESV